MDVVKERIKLFLEKKTYTFIKLNSNSIFNGYILSKSDNNSIEFEDDKLGTIPILVKEIEIIAYSNKQVGANHNG